MDEGVVQKKDDFTHDNLLNELRLTEVEDCRLFLRLDAASFEELLTMIEPRIQKQNTVMRDAIPSSQRLSITLRHLAYICRFILRSIARHSSIFSDIENSSRLYTLTQRPQWHYLRVKILYSKGTTCSDCAIFSSEDTIVPRLRKKYQPFFKSHNQIVE